MTKEQQLNIFEDFITLQRKTLLKKGDDYSNIDRLYNFKSAAKICNLTPERQALSLIATKVARLSILLDGNQKPKNESIEDSILDLANYAVLLKMIVSESKINLEPSLKVNDN